MFLASKYPIGRVERSRPFRTATRFIEILPAKRAIAAVVDYPGVGEIDFYQTHLGSVLFDEKTRAPNATSRRKLLVQLLEVADFIRSHRKSEFAILTGDLNFHYQAHEGERGYGVRYADEYRKFLETLHIAGLTVENSFLVANGMDETHAAIPTFSQENPYAREGFTRNPEETLDYVLFAPSPRWKPVESKVVFRERVSERIPALSDHYGIRTTFEFSSPEKR
jgi:endonuclease/exonuclease/phosphatase family metal-dependent hydrolase